MTLFGALLLLDRSCYHVIVSISSFEHFVPGNDEPDTVGAPGLWFVLRGTDLLVRLSPDSFDIPTDADLAGLPWVPTTRWHFLGMLGPVPCRAVSAENDAPLPPGWQFEGVRSLFGRISESFFSVAARALELLEWERASRFCGTCGTAAVPAAHERAMKCPSCGSLSFPRISPAVIMAVVRDDTILLARSRRFPPGFYSVLAGFVEPGETLEQCVAREVREETGIEVKNLRYFASQSWPFPHSLMVAFTAEYAAGEIRVDPEELVDAGWYRADALPSLPDPLTVARRLINWFCARRVSV
jgi:NAD+ diphosphatase